MSKKKNNDYKVITSYLLATLIIILLLISRLLIENSSFSFKEISYFLALISVALAASFGGTFLGLVVVIIYSLSENFLFPNNNFIISSLLSGGTESLHATTFLTESVFISLIIGQFRGVQKKTLDESENLIKSEQHLRDVLDNLFVFVGVLDKNGILLETNKTAISSADLKFRDVIGKPFYETHWWSFSKASQNNIKKAIKEALKGNVLRYDTAIRLKNNNLVTMDFSISPIKDKVGEVQYLVASGTDISYRIKALRDNISLYREVKRQKKITDNIISNIPGIVIQLSRKYNDDGFKISFINKYAEKVFGYKIGDCRNTPDLWLNTIDPNDRARVLKELEFVYKNQRNKTSEFKCINKFGKTVWVEARFGSNFDEEDKPRIEGVITDISDRKKIEQVKDEFISIASHEIKTPLTTIKAFGQILEKKIKLLKDSELTKYINKMDAYIFRLDRVVNDFLDFSKIKSGKMEYYKEIIDFDNLVSEVVNDMQAITEKHQIKLIGKSNCQIMGDKTRLSQVLINLISNAIKYSPEANEVIVNIKKENEQVMVGVKDFGMGIPKDSQKNIFGKFYRVKSPKQLNIEGFGLGLYISEEIIKRHNGKIWLESEESKGSTFYFSLPVDN